MTLNVLFSVLAMGLAPNLLLANDTLEVNPNLSSESQGEELSYEQMTHELQIHYPYLLPRHNFLGFETTFQMSTSQYWSSRYVPANKTVSAFVTDDFLYELDMDGYILHFGGDDFLDAKRKAYMSYDWEQVPGRYVLPGPNIGFWTGLNHPPIQKLEHDFSTYTQEWSLEGETVLDTPKFQRELDEITGYELSSGNEVKLLPNHHAIEGKVALAKRAQKRLYVSVMFFNCNGAVGELFEVMRQKAQAGVDVRFITEGLYQPLSGKCYKSLKDAGVKVWAPLTIKEDKPKFGVMHNKFMVVDSEEAILGGQNLLNTYAESTGFNHANRDTDVYIKGPAVLDLEEQYLRFNMRVCGKRTKGKCDIWDDAEALLAEIEAKRVEQRQQAARGESLYVGKEKLGSSGLCRTIVQAPDPDDDPVLSKVLLHSLKNSSFSVIFSTPTLQYRDEDKMKTANDKFYWTLRDKVQNEGVRGTILTNSFWGGQGEYTSSLRDLMEEEIVKGRKFFAKVWEWLFYLSAKAYSKTNMPIVRNYLEKSGVEIWSYFQYTHSKLFMFDHKWIGVTSFNMDKPSAYTNHELGLFCLDEKLNQEMKSQLTLDLVNSIPMLINTNGKEVRKVKYKKLLKEQRKSQE